MLENSSEPVKITKLLLVEDNSSDARFFCKALESSKLGQFDIICATRLSDAVALLASQKFDAIILDLFLPDSEGISTLKSILKSESHCPVVVLTGLESEAIGVEAIREGAEEYLLKGELSDKSIVRFISLALERRRSRSVNHELPSPTHFKTGLLHIDLIKQEVVFEDAGSTRPIALTPLEFKVLVLLARNPGVVFPRSRIVAEIWGNLPSPDQSQSISVRTLDKHVSSLKKKCSPALTHLQSIYGVGYSLEIQDSSQEKISI